MLIYTVYQTYAGYNRETVQLVSAEAHETDKMFIISREDSQFFGYSTRIAKEDHYRTPEGAVRHYLDDALISYTSACKLMSRAWDRIMLSEDLLMRLEHE